jgi:hypothetical protein
MNKRQRKKNGRKNWFLKGTWRPVGDMLEITTNPFLKKSIIKHGEYITIKINGIK